jgi:trans-aconitate 2-methyltransferase
MRPILFSSITAGRTMEAMWNPELYERFKAQRARPFEDLLALVQPAGLRAAVDLGCGTGELTHRLFTQLPLKETIGLDSSPEMLERSGRWARPGLRFERGDIGGFRPEAPYDLVFSNAALQWVPDHETLFPRLLGWVRPGGQVALQLPFNFDHPSHRIAHDIAVRLYPRLFAPQRALLGTLPVERYAEILFANGFPEAVCRVEVYGHPLASGAEVVEWVRGTLLTAYQSRLGEADFAAYLAAYRAEIVGLLGEGPYFFAFKRILLWGRKAPLGGYS